MSATAWQGCSKSDSAFITGIEAAAAIFSRSPCEKTRAIIASAYLSRTFAVSSTVSPRPSCSSFQLRLMALPPSWLIATSNETFVRVEGFWNIITMFLLFSASVLLPFSRSARENSFINSCADKSSTDSKSLPARVFISSPRYQRPCPAFQGGTQIPDGRYDGFLAAFAYEINRRLHLGLHGAFPEMPAPEIFFRIISPDGPYRRFAGRAVVQENAIHVRYENKRFGSHFGAKKRGCIVLVYHCLHSGIFPTLLNYRHAPAAAGHRHHSFFGNGPDCADVQYAQRHRGRHDPSPAVLCLCHVPENFPAVERAYRLGGH